ncbi:MAG: SurA N-terminal domain-containing protein [Kofleriaceae bacterium]
MFDNLRKSGSSVVVWVLFGILIAAFAVSFGPQSVGSSQGCKTGGGKSTVLTVDSTAVDESAWRFEFVFAKGADGERAKEIATLNQLLRRELLAAEGERRGLRIAEGLVDREIAAGRIHFAGFSISARNAYFDDEGKGVFDYQMFKRFVFNRFNMSVGGYKRQQTREVLASTTARILAGSVPVSRDEVMARYLADNTTVAYDVVKFEPSVYGAALQLTDAEVDRYLAAHEADVRKAYVEAAWKGKDQLRVRRVFVAKTPAPATGDAPAVDPALTKLEAARADIVAGKKTLAAVAETLDSDPAMRAKAGDWGWYDAGVLTLPAPALSDAVRALTEPGAVSPVVATTDGYYLVTVSDRRAGDLTFDQVKRELAVTAARAAWGAEAAKRAALLALASAKASGTSLADLFPDTQTGALEWTSTEDVPAAWQAGDGAAPSPAVAPAALVATDETLPQATPVKPQVQRIPAVSRFGNYTQVGKSPTMAKAIYEDLTTGALGPDVYEVELGGAAGTAYAIVQVTQKTLADVTAFEKVAAEETAKLAAERGNEYLSAWLTARCKALVDKGALRPRRDLLTTTSEDGKVSTVPWSPCSSL